MASLQGMLQLAGGSFAKAEILCQRRIAEGYPDTWLDLALLYHAQGKLDETRKCHAEYEKHFPGCQRNRFSFSWLKMHDGDLLGGLDNIEAGREIHQHPLKLNSWEWNGQDSLQNKTVLLFTEGGFGDQIMTVRSIKWLKELGAKIIIACSPELMKLFSTLNVAAVISNNFPKQGELADVRSVRHDYHIRSLSVTRLCKRKWENLWEGKYLDIQSNEIWNRIIPSGLNVGIRWRGKPTFEHEQLRLFPPEKMFNAISGHKAKFWSLQKDDTETIIPEFVNNLEPFLSDWIQTANAISRMDLIITSDTSIGHLSGAMEKPTWIIVPAMPYWPWARPGPKTSWYPSVTLYRQKCYGNWDEPFEKIKNDLTKL